MNKLSIKRALFVYQSGNLASKMMGADIVPEDWDHRDEKFKANFIKAVDNQCSESRSNSPEESHEKWMKSYLEMGWKYGRERNPELKTHPDLVPYDQLSETEKRKDEVFIRLCEIARVCIK
jgi:hypothetical protein